MLPPITDTETQVPRIHHKVEAPTLSQVISIKGAMHNNNLHTNNTEATSSSSSSRTTKNMVLLRLQTMDKDLHQENIRIKGHLLRVNGVNKGHPLQDHGVSLPLQIDTLPSKAILPRNIRPSNLHMVGKVDINNHHMVVVMVVTKARSFDFFLFGVAWSSW